LILLVKPLFLADNLSRFTCRPEIELPMRPLENIQVLSLAGNLPGPLAAARLWELGATVFKVEPPEGDALEQVNSQWYHTLHQGQEIVRLDLKDPGQRSQLNERLEQSDLLLTATRPAALARLGLSWGELHSRYPLLCQVAIVGFAAPNEEVPGHDLTYQATLGLLTPPSLPSILVADVGGAQEAVSAALGLILARERGQGAQYVEVSLAAAADLFAQPLRHGLTAPGGPLGGSLPAYNLYQTSAGWIALAALEPRFWRTLSRELKLSSPNREQLQAVFLTRSAREWEAWARQYDLPIAVLCDSVPAEEKHS
jgi:crotonobetainyl-CoA:carnitine CoA-transferase CaiB-like acyl-CoA transferase